ncbi:MAG: hypothetical protein LBC59_09565 [Chitinispirillales bacterium]|nr:hypothetical protein [Chitinispirillales bacterium]
MQSAPSPVPVKYNVAKLRAEADTNGEAVPLPLVVFENWSEVRAAINTLLDVPAIAVCEGYFKSFASYALGFVSALVELRRSGLRVRPLLLIPTNDALGYGLRDMGELAALLRNAGFVFTWTNAPDAPHTLYLYRDTYYGDFAEMFSQEPQLAGRRLLDGIFDALNFITNRGRVYGTHL